MSEDSNPGFSKNQMELIKDLEGIWGKGKN